MSTQERTGTGRARRALAALAGRGRLVALILLLGLVALRVQDPTPLKAMRYHVWDVFQQIEPRALGTDRILIVDIDERSIAQLGQWPWSRARLAQMTTALSSAGAAAIGFDMVFSEPDRLSPPAFAENAPGVPDMLSAMLGGLPDTDAAFAEALRAAPVSLGLSGRADREGDAIDRRAAAHVAYRGDPKPFLFAFPSLLRNIEPLEQAAPGRGLFSLTPEHDGVVRRVPLALRVGDRVYPSLSLEMLRLAIGAERFGTLLNAAGTGIESVGVGRLSIPTDRNGRAWLRFSHHRPDLYVSAAEVVAGRVDPARIKGKFVLVGTSAVGLRDLRLTALGETVPGVEVHAQVIDAALAGGFLKRPGYAANLEHLAALLGGALLIAAAAFLSAARSIPLLLALGLGIWGAAYAAFSYGSIALDPTYPGLAVTVVFAALAYANYARSEAQRRQIREAFSQYLSPDLVAQLAEKPEGLRLGGESREMTFLFCDIAGFTSFVEKADPERLVALLNEYLDGVCQCVMDHGGTIDKIVGDAVHAMFNAPLDDPDHAANAVRCALAIEAFVADFRERKAREGVDFGATRIGVNTGPAVVGNFGGARRFDYTAHGDAINTAARLEGANKHLGTTICVAESTRRLCPEIAFRPIGRLGLVGKKNAIATFEPVRPGRERAAPAEEYVIAFDLLDACAANVSKAFDALAEAYPQDPLVALHRRRLAAGETSADIQMSAK